MYGDSFEDFDEGSRLRAEAEHLSVWDQDWDDPETRWDGPEEDPDIEWDDTDDLEDGAGLADGNLG
jgi:hypothetical protein